MKEKTYKICKTCGKFKPCYPHHLQCCDCYLAQQKKRRVNYDLDPDYGKKYYELNREKCCNYSRAYYARKRAERAADMGVRIRRKKTKEQKRAESRDYYRRNADKMREAARLYRERKRAEHQRVAPLKHKNILEIIVETGGKCGDFDCKKCPLNYREICKPAEVVADAERLLREKAIRD